MSRSQIVRNEGMKDTVVVSENRAWAKGLWLRKQSEAGGTELDITFLRGGAHHNSQRAGPRRVGLCSACLKIQSGLGG